jgi:glycerophosphoryl diester phosphodiesterase
LWIGEDRGPFLLHVAEDGRLLDPPISFPGVAGLANPLDERNGASNLMRALARHASRHGSSRAPTVSNNARLLADGDPETGMPWRSPPATSELFDPAVLQDAGFAVVPWTVNDRARMRALLELGVAGIITDRPDLLYAELMAFDADGDGSAGDFLGPDGRVDRSRFDLQGHRGARNLRPENTLPAMEAALDAHATTLELDVGVSADGVALVSHDPIVNPSHCRRQDGTAYERAVLIRDVQAATVQSDYVCDVTSPRRRHQSHDRGLSPVAVAYAEKVGFPDPYAMPTLAQLFEFVAFYAAYYQDGAGKAHPEAPGRAADAAHVRFNVETKTNPARPDQTVGLETFVDAGMAERCNVQSFDFRTNLMVQEKFPSIATAYLFGDSPLSGGYDGANLANPAWRAGLEWPYLGSVEPTVPEGGGIGGIGASEDGRFVYVVLRRALSNHDPSERLAFVFDVERNEPLPVRHAFYLPGDGAVSAVTVLESALTAVQRRDAQGQLVSHTLTSTEPDRAGTPLGELAPSGVDALWAAPAGTLWWAGVEDGALVWRAYVRR